MKLPEDYRNFLIEHNGGCPYPNIVNLENTQTDIQCLFGMNDAPYYTGFFDNLDSYIDRVPNFYMPIGNDSFGNIFLLSLRDSNFGEIAFWRHEQELKEGDAGEYFGNIEVVASSFSEFVDNLVTLDYTKP